MKRYLTLLALLISFASFAKTVPAWDRALIKSTTIKPAVAFSDPYLEQYDAWVTGSGAYKELVIYFSISESCNYTYKLTLSIYGNWAGIGWGYKEFDAFIYPGGGYTYYHIPIEYNDYPQTTVMWWVYDGPA